ncbi:MAG: STN domain-containing protein [Pirellulaceae bacterium]|nr:STN domain-containing protein [Pirellulaceae bacterium]
MMWNFSAHRVGSVLKCWLVAVASFPIANFLVAPLAVAPWVIAAGMVLTDRETLAAQDQDTPASTVSNQDPPAVPEISDQPRVVDPTEFLPEKLTKKVSVDLRSASLGEMVDWLRTQVELTVLVQYSELDDEQISTSDPISDWLEDEPIYLLLDRLRLLGIGWYYEGEVLYLTTRAAVDGRQVTTPYLLGELLDGGYNGKQIVRLIESLLEPNSWENSGGNGRINLIGDMIFVRNTAAVQRKIRGLLTGLPQHGRQTLLDTSTTDRLLRDKLASPVSVEYKDMPLEEVVRDLASQSGTDLRLDRPALRQLRVRDRQPVTLQIRQQPLKTVLDYLLPQIGLGWRIRDGVLWITAPDRGEIQLTALYDVRDLCRDMSESDALREAVQSQMPSVFEEDGGEAVIDFGKPGTMVVWATPSEHDVLLELLEKYRFALRQSKVRVPSETEDAIKTLYYRLHANVARALHTELPKLIAPDSWQSTERPDAIGTIVPMESPSEVVKGEGATSISTERMVLIIRQRQSVHTEITKTLQRIENGDPETRASAGMGGMGGMGGGFGGGMFSLPGSNANPK